MVGPIKGQTAVCGCQFPRDIAVRMRKVLSRSWTGVCVLLALCLPLNEAQSIFQQLVYFMTFLKKIQQRLRVGKIFASWHLAIATTSIMHNLPPSHDNKTIEIDRTENPRNVGVKRFDILIDAQKT